MKNVKISLDNIEEVSKPIELFYQGCKSKETKRHYTICVNKIVNDYLQDILKSESFEERVNELVSRAKDDPKWIMKIMTVLIKTLKDQTNLEPTDKNFIKARTVCNYTNAVKKLLDMNEVPLIWKKVYSMLPEMNLDDSTRGYTREEIQKILRCAKTPERVSILIASSSGIRSGAFDFQWKDVRPVYLYENELLWEDDKITETVEKKGRIVCGMILIYKGSTASQFAFITPETVDEIQQYKVYWENQVGIPPKPDEPFFKYSGCIVRPLSSHGVACRIYEVVTRAGLRPKLSKGQRKHSIPIMNGFRRFFNKTNKESLSKDSVLGQLIKKEMMMGHSGLIQLDRNYFKIHVKELIEEYLNAVPNLTISDEERLQRKNENLSRKNDELQNKAWMISNLQNQVSELQTAFDIMKKSIEVNPQSD